MAVTETIPSWESLWERGCGQSPGLPRTRACVGRTKASPPPLVCPDSPTTAQAGLLASVYFSRSFAHSPH